MAKQTFLKEVTKLSLLTIPPRCRSSTMTNENSVTGLFRCAALPSQQAHQMALSRVYTTTTLLGKRARRKKQRKKHSSKIPHEEAPAKACVMIMVLHERSLSNKL